MEALGDVSKRAGARPFVSAVDEPAKLMNELAAIAAWARSEADTEGAAFQSRLSARCHALVLYAGGLLRDVEAAERKGATVTQRVLAEQRSSALARLGLRAGGPRLHRTTSACIAAFTGFAVGIVQSLDKLDSENPAYLMLLRALSQQLGSAKPLSLANTQQVWLDQLNIHAHLTTH